MKINLVSRPTHVSSSTKDGGVRPNLQVRAVFGPAPGLPAYGILIRQRSKLLLVRITISSNKIQINIVYI